MATLLTPAARPRRPFPWVYALAFAALDLAAGLFRGSPAPEGFLGTAAVLAACGLGSWAEQRVYDWASGKSLVRRLLLALAAPIAGFGAIPFAALAGRWVSPQRFAAVTSGALAAASAWFALAAVGSLVVLFIDLVISALVPDFKSRIAAAVFALLALVAGGAAVLGNALPRAMAYLAEHSTDFNLKVDFGPGALSAAELAEFKPELASFLVMGSTAAMLLLALPALLSACAKLADAVMERLTPLDQAFALLGKGQLEVRVEEKGSVEFVRLNHSFNQMVQSLDQARGMERTFGAYLGAPILERIRAQHSQGELPATARVATVMFADIRGFTPMSEKLAPPVVLDLLNRYLERAVQVVEAHEGYINKFIGDAIVVVFNGPIDQPDHAVRGARCALALQAEIARLNVAGAFPEVGTLNVGVGLASGPLVAGNLGKTRTEYTVIGDTVNLAARLTSHAGAGEVWVNEANAQAQSDVRTEPLAEIKVKGKTMPVHPFRLLAGSADHGARA